MNYEIYGWLVTITLFTLVALLIGVTWMVAVENGYDKGFKSGYKRGTADTKQTNVKV
jgi:threonine/homoserine/homoserine lactone efflux protein